MILLIDTVHNTIFNGLYDTVSVHCREEGCIGKYTPRGPRDCPRASPSGNLSGLGVQNPRPWKISWASGSVFSNTSLLSAVYGYITSQCTLTTHNTKLCAHLRPHTTHYTLATVPYHWPHSNRNSMLPHYFPSLVHYTTLATQHTFQFNVQACATLLNNVNTTNLHHWTHYCHNTRHITATP